MPGKMPFPPKGQNPSASMPKGMMGKNPKNEARQGAIKRRMMKNGDKPGGY